ncbi:complex I intermediate-associated protein CIA30 [Artomyces pyxidatus]|uniref:Complex I intermediate-associated protein CIA30 n=1 Tax=Artomyces pyxidatus TaxID=48021 RepID=A0ACB8TG66_9AGAM|nr:complex I intermediate-associated protein CIA30 [Artomyces pyxidatus]
MAMSRWSTYLNRSSRILRDNTSKILRMQGAEPPSLAPYTLFTLNTPQDLAEYATGCDADIGGTSTVHLDLDTDPARNAPINKPGHARFWGDMRLAVRPGLQGKVRGGYAGFRNKTRPTLFGELTEDVTHHKYLALRLRAAGHPRTRNSYFVNIQTDGPISSDLWQHRLYFTRSDGGWEDIFIPFDAFVLTNTGEIASDQITMLTARIRTVGISLLGGNSGVEGPYELGVDEIRAVNEEDVVQTKIHQEEKASEELASQQDSEKGPL